MMPYNKQRNGDLLAEKRPAGHRRSMMPYMVAIICLIIAVGGYYAWKTLRFARQPKPVVVADTIDLKLYYPVPPFHGITKSIKSREPFAFRIVFQQSLLKKLHQPHWMHCHSSLPQFFRNGLFRLSKPLHKRRA